MSSYGLQIGNLPPITGNRKIMRLSAAGQTRQVSSRRHVFRFRCAHRDFCVYFRPLQTGVPTASQVVHDVGAGIYDAYFVGAVCQVYVYERKHDSAAGRYGLQLFNAQGSVAFDNGDEPMCPLPNLYIPPLGENGRVQLFDAATARRRAVNMHANRVGIGINFGNATYTCHRDALLLDGGGLYYVFGYNTPTFRVPGGAGGRVPNLSVNDRWGGLAYAKPTSVGVVDTFIHD